MAGESTRFTSAIQIGTTALLALATGTMLYIAGNAEITGNVTVTGVINQTGSIVPLNGSLTLTEVDGYASGALAIPNPVDDDVICSLFAIDVTTASNPTTLVDAYVGTGTIATIQKDTTGSLLLFNNLTLSAGLRTASGSGIAHGDGSVKSFKLVKSSATSGNKYINIVSQNQTGATLVGTYNGACYRTQ